MSEVPPAGANAAPESAGIGQESSDKSSGGLSFLWRPEADINYNFILGAYVVCSLICGLLFVADRLSLLEAIRGYWIVFAPFIVMTPWAVFMQRKARKVFGAAKEKKD